MDPIYLLERGECGSRKIGGEEDPADVLTKPMARESLDRRLGLPGCHNAQPAKQPEWVPPEGVCEDVGFDTICDIPFASCALATEH